MAGATDIGPETTLSRYDLPIPLDQQEEEVKEPEEKGLKRHSSSVCRQRYRQLSRPQKAASSIFNSSVLSGSSIQYNSSNKGSLLRKSSDYFRSKLNLFKKKQPHPSIKSIGENVHTAANATELSKVAITNICMQTTITLPSKKSQLKKSSKSQEQVQQELNHAQLLQQFPITSLPKIHQYPPKPLVYSTPQFEEPLDEQTQQQQRTLLHRISMPLLSSDPFNKKSLMRHKNRSMTSLHSAFKKRRKSVSR